MTRRSAFKSFAAVPAATIIFEQMLRAGIPLPLAKETTDIFKARVLAGMSAQQAADSMLKICHAADLTGIPPARVKITGWHPDTCGCYLEYAWDAATIDKADDRVHTAVLAKCCPIHACHTTPRAAFDAVLAETQAKNRAVGAMAELHGVEADRVEWSLNAERKVSVKLGPAPTPTLFYSDALSADRNYIRELEARIAKLEANRAV